ncbi:uncharacterized protein SPSK_06529 [Sporothrix schenckii 1099-18]|uniref:Uncharacterized protein n=1 Tax=Sporothrix schenckii 1099-18 TaxID=1397361 RepID=A0A0F2MIT9_SPOSC|nr:uncharacterized protein SPSK_06529 [Sporothrix schenckii 1099-18]KJR89532.1 hypothetical protein SPSK_06529 [Sporothrix schenckii 1099-18]
MTFSVATFVSWAAAVAAFGAHNPPPKGEVTKTDNFVWADPFHDHRLANKLTAACTVEKSFRASEFLLHDLYEHPPKGLWNYGDALKTFFSGRPYPGGWDGLDPHMYDRPLLQMDYADVPVIVREWIEAGERYEKGGGDGDKDRDDDDEDDDEEGKALAGRKNLFAVFERAEGQTKITKTVAPPKTAAKAAMLRPLDAKRIVVFAPGALYSILPLWVATDAAADDACRKQLLNLDLYSPKPKDGGVIAWTTQHTAPDRDKIHRNMTFTIKAQTLQAAGAASFGGKEEL